MSVNKSINQLINTLIDIVWSKAVENQTSKDFVYVSQALDLITKLQDLMNCREQLLNSNEKLLLLKMASDKPLLKLFKHEFVPFILRLMNFRDIETFLMERGRITPYDIEKAISRSDRPFRKPLSPYNMKINNGKSPARPISTSTPMTYNIRPQSRQTVSPPQSPVMLRTRPYDRKEMHGLRTSVLMKEQQLNDREEQYSSVANENNQLSSANRIQSKRIQNLETDIKDLKKYIETLEYQLERRSIEKPNTFGDKNIIKELVNKGSENEKVIQHLEKICEKHQKELLEYKTKDEKYEPIIEKLILEMNKQDELVSKLKHKLELDDRPSNNHSLQHFLQNLPFVKQYYMYYKYHQDQKNFGNLFINTATLCLTTVMVLNIMKFAFYFIIYLFDMNKSTHESDLLEYVYDDYGINNWFNSNDTAFVWWKEIEWLEYWIYRISDWIDS